MDGRREVALPRSNNVVLSYLKVKSPKVYIYVRTKFSGVITNEEREKLFFPVH